MALSFLGSPDGLSFCGMSVPFLSVGLWHLPLPHFFCLANRKPDSPYAEPNDGDGGNGEGKMAEL